MRLKNKVAIVTGARRGIGRGIVEAFAKEGANVIVSDINLKDCEKVCKDIKKKYKVKAIAVECDVSNSSEVQNMINTAIKKFGKIDILVNNAGIFFSKPFLEYTEEDWDKIIDINLKSIYLCSQAAAKFMIKKKKNGKIINITSIAGIVGYLGGAAYCASKGGIITLTKEIALELAPYINVNAIAPGAIETPMTSFLKKDKKLLKATLAGIPLKRIGKPIDIAMAAVYLASDESSYLTGHTLIVDGGWTIQ